MTKRKKGVKPADNATSSDNDKHKATANEDTLAALEGKTTNTKSDDSTGDSSAGPSKQQAGDRTSWAGGSWRGKATAVAEIARESIPGSTSFEKSVAAGIAKDTSQRLSQGISALGKASPSVGSAIRLNVTSGTTERDGEVAEKDKPSVRSDTGNGAIQLHEKPTVSVDGTEETALKERPTPAAGWLGWWSRREDGTATGNLTDANNNSSLVETAKSGLPETVAASTTDADTQRLEEASQNRKNGQVSVPKIATQEESSGVQPARTSWFGLLGAGSNNGVIEYQGLNAQDAKTSVTQPSNAETPINPPSVPEPAIKEEAQSQKPENATSGSWAFWSRQTPKSEATTGSETNGKSLIGELAVSGTDSQSKPMAALIGQEVKAAATAISKKRDGPVTSETSSPKRSAKDSGKATTKSEASSESEVPTSMQDSVLKTTIDAPKKVKRLSNKAQPNIVLPAFEKTFRPPGAQSYWSKLSWVWGRPATQHPTCLSVSSSPQRPKRALAIGIHGLVPTAMVQKILGPPTGTSIRFADGAADAIRKITQARGYPCEIEKVALEGEGLIAERVDSLWKLLLNWIDQIRKADFIFIACHSQGVPVAISIVARLLNFGCVGSSARVGICAMAGVSLGPFPSYQSRFLGSTATELFSLSSPSHPVSQAYNSALSTCLAHHVRILYIGSIDDQLVSLSSATHTSAIHPYIYRAVFVDGRIHAPDFLTHLVGFALKLRNLGVGDHGLVKELSGPLAGSLYTGEGHSRIYEEQDVYELGVRHALDTETLNGAANPALEVKAYETPASGAAANPYFLPWAMRGVLEEELVRTELKGETEELLALFEKWRPTSKVLKDVRFRLEAVKSKL